MDCNLINSIGLFFDIIGVVLLFKYGLPADISKDGSIRMIFQGTDHDEVNKWKKYNFWSRFALILIIIGFALQILSNQTCICAFVAK
ncbi:MAG: hypothetical protein R2814_03695 [Flavobacteriaceae bacterium]